MAFGFVLTADDPFVGGDLDHCLDPETGEMEEFASKIIGEINTYTEKSPSGEGLRFIAEGKLPGPRTRNGKIELYQKNRYLTITGWHIPETPAEIHERQEEIGGIYQKYIDPLPAKSQNSKPNSLPCTLTVDEIIMDAKNRFGKKFEDLLQGGNLGYPSSSEADLAFCGMLTQFTGGDAGKIDTIFQQSGRMRPKWNERRSSDGKTYGQMTIHKAINGSNPLYVAEANVEMMLGNVKDNPATPLRLILETPDYLKGLALLAKNDVAKYELALARLKEVGLNARDLASLKSAVTSEKKRLGPLQGLSTREQGGTPVGDSLPDLPVPETFLIPVGYSLSRSGISRLGNPSPRAVRLDRLIATAPILIQGRLKDVSDYTEQLKLVWRREEKWQSATVPRETIMNARLITSLAGQGFPVNSETARFVVEYLDLLEAINIKQIPVATVSSRLGWQGEKGKKRVSLRPPAHSSRW